MKYPIEDVKDFYSVCGVSMPVSAKIPEEEIVKLCYNLIEEEVVKELLPAIKEHDLPAIADGIVDSIYVLISCALRYGIPLGTVWNIVHKANMAKVDPVTGIVKRREDGKILKPEGWTPPDIKGFLERYNGYVSLGC